VRVAGRPARRQPSGLVGIALAAVLVGGAVTAGGYAVAAADEGAAGEVLGPGTETVTITIEDSRFRPDRIRVHEGTQVRFVVRNTDPIGHELVVGPESVHLRHARGTEAAHPPVPGEVSLGPGQTGATVYDFDGDDDLRIVCHLPRHEDYGMEGLVDVVSG
jgi:uncharacterized cupredoxin-like copper-binding protein